ncbi:MAG: HlyD family secretion protein [Bdellovibrio sp.]|nr:HlyD family secretion protein [Bdellovibrio sp.]
MKITKDEMIQKLSKPTVFVPIAAVTVCLGLLFYWFYWSNNYISTENAYVETELSPVNSRLMGYVREVLVQENDIVKKGQEILKLDDVDTKLELSFKQAKLKKAMADGARATRLQKEHALSDSDFELAEATLAGIKAEVDGSLLKLQFTSVVSATDGIVAKRSAQPGQFVQPGQSLFVIVPTDKIWIRANFKENQIRLIKPGQPVEIEVDAYPGEAWTGTVDYVYPSSVASLSLIPPENATGNFTKVVQRFPVHISFTQRKEHPLLPGMSVEATVVVK